MKKGGKVKHVPLCFVLMSHRRKRDYRAVFKEVRSALPSLAVTEVTLRQPCEGPFGTCLASTLPIVDVSFTGRKPYGERCKCREDFLAFF